MSREGGQFLHEQNPNLHKTPEVELVADYLRTGGERIPNNPAAKLGAHLDFLADPDYVNDGILTGEPQSVQRQIEAHVVRDEDVPEGYFWALAQQLHEQGHGDIDALFAQITPEMRRAEIEARQADQRASLSKWVEYLGGNDGGYPDWFKYYVWNAITKLGVYNKEKQEFSKRSTGTMAAYPDLNREALAYVYDKLQVARIEHQVQDDEQLQALLERANFGQLYIYAVKETAPTSPELLNTTEGSWRKYDQSSDPRIARRLSESLQGHGTGWCTAGESTAAQQLSQGDFYVYYTHDEEGKDTIPRVAIRMQNGQVAEVRGINAAQELEPEFADIASQQLQSLPGGETYLQKAEDMKHLTRIAKLLQDEPQQPLQTSDFRFLYELDHSIEGFGYERDPRIKAIRQARGEVDRPEIIRLMPEVIREQLESSYRGYQELAQTLGIEVQSEQQVQAVFTAKHAEWQQSNLYEYLADQLIEHGSRHTLVITPDELIDISRIIAAAKAFGDQQPVHTFVYNNLYNTGEAQGVYTPQAMSGDLIGTGARISLIPSATSAELGYKTAAQQRQILAQLQVQAPSRNYRVPSMLEGLSYWSALRAKRGSLQGSGVYNETFIRHFDIEPVEAVGWSGVPCSYVVGNGGRAWTARLPRMTTSLGSRWGKSLSLKSYFIS